MRVRQNSVTFIITLVLCVACDAEKASNTKQADSADSLEKSMLVRYCGGCHVAPKPETKTASQWPAVVLRMQIHRSQRAMPILNDSEIDEVTDYLIMHSKGL